MLCIPWSESHLLDSKEVTHGLTFQCRVEYRALAHVCAETVWIAHLFFDIRLPLHRPITLYCDNLSTTYMASNPVFHARTKHIELDYHFVRERVVSGSHIVRFVPSADQTADIFTKGLHKHRFEFLRSKLV